MITFQEMLKKLAAFWEQQGCIQHQGYDLETGAGTFNPTTFLRGLGPEPYKAVYFEPCRRPSDGRYGTNPNRVQHYFQGQVIMKPSPPDILDLCLQSLQAIGFDLSQHDMRFIHDDWESPTLGAWGLGWEVWMDGMEVAQFTYFQSLGGVALKPITAEITYGLERLALYLQKVNSIFDLKYNDTLTYGDIYFNNEVEWSHYNFTQADTAMWSRHFDDYEKEARKLLAAGLPIPAYDFVLKGSHAFNLLDARGVISVTERTGYIARIRDLACEIAKSYIQSREKMGYPLLKHNGSRAILADHEIKLPPLNSELTQVDPTKRADFVLEIGSEELPATFVPIGTANLAKAFKQLLDAEGITYDDIRADGSPRRLLVYVKNLALGKPAQSSERRGPAIENAFDAQGNMTAAGMGFMRSINKDATTLKAVTESQEKDLAIRNIKGCDYLVAIVQIPGCATAELLAREIPNLICTLEFPKKMRWGTLDISYARPLRWFVALFGSHVLPFALGGLASGRTSWGHRQLCNHSFDIPSASAYFDLLREHKVMASMEERKQTITKQLDKLEKDFQGTIIAREQVLPQVINMSEWPTATVSTYDAAFLKVPKEVLISEMVEHQKYFPIANAEGKLKNEFVITADTTPTEEIRAGNQKVLSARLSDGVFLYEQGLKVPLEHFNNKLKQVTFQKELGSTYNKVVRLQKHANYLQNILQISTPELVSRAAELSKADLATEMVFEFPDLQGTIGRYYAMAQGENSEVAQAIEEQWMPRKENAPLPESTTGIILSLADKIDNLLGCFAVGLKPTSSSDPYSLRRQTLGIIKMLIKAQLPLPLKETFTACLKHLNVPLQQSPEALVKEIDTFVINRIKTVFLDYGLKKDEIEAALSFGCNDIYDAFCKVRALHAFRARDQIAFGLLYEVYKRAKGQLIDKHDKQLQPQYLREQAEIALNTILEGSQPHFMSALQNKNYDAAYQLIAQLQPPLATLFNEVKILDDDPAIQTNRLALLQKVFDRFALLLDFNKIQV